MVESVSYRRMMISKRYSPERLGNCFIPLSQAPPQETPLPT